MRPYEQILGAVGNIYKLHDIHGVIVNFEQRDTYAVGQYGANTLL